MFVVFLAQVTCYTVAYVSCSMTYHDWHATYASDDLKVIKPTLLHRLLTSPVPSILGTGVVLRIARLTSCVSCYVTHQSCACLTSNCPSSLIRMHVVMQLVLCCCSSMMMVYTRWHIIAASTLRRNATMGVVRKNCWQYTKRVLSGDAIQTVCLPPSIQIINLGSIFGHNRI